MALRASTDFELVEAIQGQQLVGVPVALHQQSTLNSQLARNGFGLRANYPKPAGKRIERFEEWLADSGVLKKPVSTDNCERITFGQSAKSRRVQKK